MRKTKESEARGRSTKLKPLKLLLVEDHEDTRQAIRVLLEMEGLTVLEAKSAKEGLAIAQREPFDLMLCDLMLPDGTGWDLMERLSPKKPIVCMAMSGLCSPTDLQRSECAGFFAHLIKPFGIERMKAKLLEAQRELERCRLEFVRRTNAS